MKPKLDDLRETFESSPYFNLIGFKIVELEKEQVTISLPVHERLLNTRNMIHGGVYASMIDTILSVTIRSYSNVPLATINLNVYFLKSCNDGTLTAKAKIIHKGNSIVTAEGEIFDQQGNLLAKGTGTFKVLSDTRSK
jgi:uncharacterized protein (TIGR00369 family)